jgi:hypothetical protein
MIKPVVHYIGEAQIYVWPYSEEDNPILVGYLPKVIDHPYLGYTLNVRTSQIIVPPDESGKFETLNTIYEPYQNS